MSDVYIYTHIHILAIIPTHIIRYLFRREISFLVRLEQDTQTVQPNVTGL